MNTGKGEGVIVSIDAEALARLRSLLAKATPGPWHLRKATSRYHLKADNGDYIIEAGKYCVRQKADGELIAAMRKDIEALLDIAEAVARAPVVEVTREDWLENCTQFGADLIGKRVRIVPCTGGAE